MNALLALVAAVLGMVAANLVVDFRVHLANVRAAFRDPSGYTGPAFALDVAGVIAAQGAPVPKHAPRHARQARGRKVASS